MLTGAAYLYGHESNGIQKAAVALVTLLVLVAAIYGGFKLWLPSHELPPTKSISPIDLTNRYTWDNSTKQYIRNTNSKMVR